MYTPRFAYEHRQGQERVRIRPRVGLQFNRYFRRNATEKGEVETTTPKIHELIIMDEAEGLRRWLDDNPGDVELQHHLKTPLLVAIKFNVWHCFNTLVGQNAKIEAETLK